MEKALVPAEGCGSILPHRDIDPGGRGMTEMTGTEDRLKIEGALEILFPLKEDFAQWVEEAQEDSKHEALDNVLAHVERIEGEYRQRLAAAKSG